MKTIEEIQKDKEPNFMHKILTYDWIFSSPLEKLIITLVFAFAMYSLGRMIF